MSVEALTFLAEDDEQISRFVALTGIDPGEIRHLVGKTEFLAAVLDYIASDESLLLAFAANRNIAPERIARAIHALAPRIDDPFD